jgi:hypothetical protein
MKRSMSLRRLVLSGLVGLAVSVVLCGADDAKQKVDAKGLTFEAPASWKSSPPTGSMRRAELKVQPIDGDDFPGELVVYAFPGGVGPVQTNLDRWKSQFKDKGGNSPEVATKKVKGKNVDVTRAETSGHYHPAQFPGRAPDPDRDDARLLGAIVVTDQVTYVIKMVGPNKTMSKISPDFDALLATINVEAQ